MKKMFVFVSIFLLLFTACSNKAEVELVSVKSDIVKDKSKTGSLIIQDKKESTEVVPTSLLYEFRIKNNSGSTLSTEVS